MNMPMTERIRAGKLFTDMCEGLPEKRLRGKTLMYEFNHSHPSEVEKRKSLQFCLEQHLGELERRREGLVKMQEMCERLIAEHQSLDTLNAENCLEEIEQMEKEGARFMDIKKTDIRKKRRTGAIIGAVVMILLMGFTIGLMLWANTQDPIPTGLLIFLIAIPVVIIGGILAALAGRMKEIEGGEEDEASKY